MNVIVTEHTESGNCRFLAYIPSWWKNLPSLVRVGCTPPPPHIYHHVQTSGVRSSWEGRHTLPISPLTLYVLCGYSQEVIKKLCTITAVSRLRKQKRCQTSERYWFYHYFNHRVRIVVDMNRENVSALSAGAYFATLNVRVNRVKGGGRASPPPPQLGLVFLHDAMYTRKRSLPLCVHSVRITDRSTFFCIFFWRARVCRQLLRLFRPFMIFEGCLDSNPECCRSKLARYRLSHPSLFSNPSLCIYT
jgi:hypothetical protein